MVSVVAGEDLNYIFLKTLFKSSMR